MNDKFENKLNKTLRAGSKRIDQATRDELARRRRLALDATAEPRAQNWIWLSTGAVAAALLAVVMARPFSDAQMPVAELVAAETDMEILLADDFELIEDLEFYEWLDVVDDAG